MAPRTCKPCGPDREVIDRKLVDGIPLRTIADQHATSHQALIRHRDNHLASAVKQAAETSVLEQANALWVDAQALKAQAEAAGDVNLALRAVDRLIRLVELRGKATGELQSGGSVTTLNTVVAVGEWPELRSRILPALGQFPAARQAVLAELTEAPDAGE